MLNKPTRHQQTNRKQNRRNSQPILPRPPKRQQKAHAQSNTSDLARRDVEPAKNQQCANERRAKVSSRKCDSADAATHVRHAALARIEGDGLDAAACAAGCGSVGEFVEGDGEHLDSIIRSRYSNLRLAEGIRSP